MFNLMSNFSGSHHFWGHTLFFCVPFLVFCETEGEHADADALNVLKGIGTGDEGGASGTDVINEQDVLAT